MSRARPILGESAQHSARSTRPQPRIRGGQLRDFSRGVRADPQLSKCSVGGSVAPNQFLPSFYPTPPYQARTRRRVQRPTHPLVRPCPAAGAAELLTAPRKPPLRHVPGLSTPWLAWTAGRTTCARAELTVLSRRCRSHVKQVIGVVRAAASYELVAGMWSSWTRGDRAPRRLR